MNLCTCRNSLTGDPCVVCGKPKMVSREWASRMATREGDADPTTGSASLQEVAEARPIGSPTAFTRDQLARLAFVVFYSPVLCAPQNINAVVDEIDCCPGCDHVSGSGSCHVSERGDYCPNDLAETLRQISIALYGPGSPNHYVESVFGADHMPALAAVSGGHPHSAHPPRRCDTNITGAAGECLACEAEQGVFCLKPEQPS